MSTPAQRLESDRWKYPGMAPREVLIFRAWLLAHQTDYDSFDYNVRLGNGIDPGPDYPQIYRDQYIQNTQKRADVVAWAGKRPFVLEVKDRAIASSMSQLLTYSALWPVTFPGTRNPDLVLIANRVSADMPMVLDNLGIRLDIVEGVDFSVLANPKPQPPTP